MSASVMLCMVFIGGGLPHTQESNKYAYYGGQSRKNPGPHDDFGLRPALGLKMVMKRRGEKNFFSEKFLGEKLEGGAPRLQNVDKHDDEKGDDGVGEQGNDAQSGAESHGARVAHEEARRINVEPEKSQKAS